MVRWTYPTLLSQAVAHTLLYKGTSNDFNAAVLLDIATGAAYFHRADGLDDTTTYYYWVKLVSVNGTVGNLIGPASATMATQLDSLTSALLTAITESMLSGDLKTRIDQIDGFNDLLSAEEDARLFGESAGSAALAAVVADLDDIDTLVLSEISERIDGDAALVTQINALIVVSEDNAAAILAEQIVRADADGALAGDILSLEARMLLEIDPADLLPVLPGAAYATYVALNTAIAPAAADIRKYYRVVDPTDALEEVLYRSNGTSWSLVGTEQYAQLEQVMRVTASKTTGLESQYTLKVSAGNAVAGIGLAATDFDGVPSSIFIVQADKFALIASSDYIQDTTPTATAAGETWYKPSTQQDFRSTAAGTGSWVLYTSIAPFGVDTATGTAFISNSLRIGSGGATLSTVVSEANAGAYAYAAVIDGTTGLATRMGLAVQNVLSGEGGLKIGTIDWDAAGVVDPGGYGVAITAKGIVGRNVAGDDTFVLDATTGEATFLGDIETAGRVVATGGETYSGVLAAMHAIAGAVGGVGLYGSSGLYGNAGVDGYSDGATGTRGAAISAGGIGVVAQGSSGADALSVLGPMLINNSTLVSNLNAEYLNGNASSAFATSSHTHNLPGLNTSTTWVKGETSTDGSTVSQQLYFRINNW